MTTYGVDRSGAAGGSGSDATPIDETVVTAKGDLIAGTGSGAVDNLAVGANETRLVADSTQTTGLKYVVDTTNYAIVAKGDLLPGTAADTVSPLSVGTDGHLLVPNSGSTHGMLWLPPGARAERIINGQIVESHASNAVTYTLKGKGGVDLSATNPCYLLFPSATLTSGDFDIVKVTENISVTVSSGSTLGHASGIAQHTFVYALKTGSSAELFVSNLPPDYPSTFLGQRTITTTAEGGAGAADSATGIYSTTARAGVVWIPVAKVRGTQTTAGTWAADPTQIDMAPFSLPRMSMAVYLSADQSVNTGTETKLQFNTEEFDTDSVYDAVTNFRWQPNIAGEYQYTVSALIEALADAASFQVYAKKTGSQNLRVMEADSAAAGSTVGVQSANGTRLNGTTEYLEFYCFHTHGSARNVSGGGVNESGVFGTRIGAQF